MKDNLSLAKQLLSENNYTSAAVMGEQTYTSSEKGVKPLINWLDGGISLKGFSAADKVVGKGAAMLYILLGIKEIYAAVISDSAYDILKKYNIDIQYDKKVPKILNRTKTGYCPIETAVLEEFNPFNAPEIIKNKLNELKKISEDSIYEKNQI